MGCGMVHFGRRGLETTQTDKIWSKILSPWVLTRPNAWGEDFRPNFVSLGGFQTSPTKMIYTTPHHIPKYENLQKKKKIVHYPLKAVGPLYQQLSRCFSMINNN